MVTGQPSMPPGQPASGRFAVLDGWRAASILLVLAGHLLPLGPKAWGLNSTAATSGMVLFFILSGFLITRFLADGADLRLFAIRRLARIVPLAWAVMLVLLVIADAPWRRWAANLLFVANLGPDLLLPGGGHLWSLCVEMQFYLGIALLVALAGRRALLSLPLLALVVTGLRVAYARPLDIATPFRVDEILAGGMLALAYGGHYGPKPAAWLARLNAWALLAVLPLCAHPALPAANYLRPYVAAALIGATLYAPPSLIRRWSEHAWVGWLAGVSYAVYIFHGALVATWLGTGDQLVRYAKRPLLVAATLLLAQLSTRWFERPLIGWAKRATAGWSLRVPA